MRRVRLSTCVTWGLVLSACLPGRSSSAQTNAPGNIRDQVIEETLQAARQRRFARSDRLTPPDLHGDRFALHGQVRHETAYRLGTSGEFTKLRQEALLQERLRFSDDLRFVATQRGWYDGVFDATDNFPDTVDASQEWLLEVRDTYLDYSAGAFDVRAGKQQIVWGDAVGLFFADVVNAKDLREYVLPEFDLIRIPQWALDVEYAQGPLHTEFVWLPVRAFHRLGVSGSEFEWPLPVPEGFSATLVDPSKPPASLSNSEVGGRVSYLVEGWDVSGFYLYTWNKLPVMFRTINGNRFDFAPRYRRANLIGGSFSKALSDRIILNGELLINPQSDLTTFDTTDTDGILRRGAMDYLLGFDWRWRDEVRTTLQWMQRIIPHHEDLMQEDAVSTHLACLVSADVWNGKLEPELLVIAGLRETDVLYRPKLTFKATSQLALRVGADIFQGVPTGLFGRFDRSSRVYAEATYYF